jgi:hypothetical protein
MSARSPERSASAGREADEGIGGKAGIGHGDFLQEWTAAGVPAAILRVDSKAPQTRAFDGARRFSDDSTVLPSSLTVSIVTYRSDAVLLERCLDHLADAIRDAREQRVLTQVAVALIDNSENATLAGEGIRLAKRAFADSGVQLHFLNGHSTSATASRTT